MNKKALVVAALIFTGLLVIGLISVWRFESAYELSAAETLDLVVDPSEYEILPEDVAYFIDFEEPGYVYVDLRSPYEFVKGHISGAKNIPENMLLEEASMEFFEDAISDSLTIVLYGHDEAAAAMPWMLLRQLGYQHLKVMKGGWEYYANESLDPYDMPEIPKYRVEEPAYDFMAIREMLESGKNVVKPAEAQEVVIPKRKKKKTVVEGGC